MLYVFTSAVGPSVTYTEAVGASILRAAGKTPGPRGVITPAENEAVEARLKAAAEHARATEAPATDDEEDGAQPEVALGLRLVPLLELLARSRAAGKDVTWGI